MQPCEQCEGTKRLLKKQQCGFLEKHGIRPESFIAASPWQRLGLLREHLRLDRHADREASAARKDLGLIVVKPEMFDQSAAVEKYLTEKLEMEILSSQPFVYTPEAYWVVYGKNFVDYFSLFPHGALLLLLSANLASRAIVFKHLLPARYCELKRTLAGPDASGTTPFSTDEADPQDFFDKLFVRDGAASIRSKVCRPSLASRGFIEMVNDSCPGQCWDFTRSFSKRTLQQNRRTFNGIHCPENQKELAVAFTTLPIKI